MPSLNSLSSNPCGVGLRSRSALDRPSWPVLGIVLTLVLATAGLAIVPGEQPQTSPPEGQADMALQVELTQREVWRDFLERHGEWSVLWREGSGMPQRAISHGYSILPRSASRSEVLSATRSFIDQNHELFGLFSEDLNLSYAERTNKEWVVVFNQHRNGVPVVDGKLTFIVTFDGKLPIFETRKTFNDLAISTIPALPLALAEATFHTAMIPNGVPEGATLQNDASELVILGVGSPECPRLAWRVGMLLNEIPHHFVGYIDANNGEILRWSDEIYYLDVQGHVDGRAHQDHPATSITVQDMPNILVQVQGGNSTFANDNGDFVISHPGTNPVNVTVAVQGRWARVNNTRGGEISDTTSFTPGTPGSIRLNPTSSAEFTVHQVDAYLQVTKVHNYFKSVFPTATSIDCQYLANVNINSTCNAFFNGSSTNYFNRGGSCNNTAFASIIAHELGHEYDFKYGGIVDGALSEGFGDILSMYLLGYPTIGPFFFNTGGGIRNGNNNRTFPGSECGGQVHCRGEIIMGYAWKLRQQLIADLGSGPGADAAEQAVLATFIGNPSSMSDCVIQSFIFDDDNGDLSDGTPHFDQLSNAAMCKNFDVPAPPIVDSVNPTNIGRCPGTRITINGQFFLAGFRGNEVRIGGIQANIIEVNRGLGTIKAEIPGLAPGTYDVTVSTPFGSSLTANAINIDSSPEVVLEGFKVGETTNVRVCGLSDANYFLAASLSEGSETFEGAQLGLGRRVFIVANSFSGPSAPLDAQGLATIALAVPSNPNLSFVSPFFQAGIRTGGTWDVTEVERATIFP